MTDKEKLLRIKKLADEMYCAAQYLTTDASHMHKAMDEYHQFIVHDYHKEEPVSEDLEEAAHHYYMPFETFMDGFKKGAKWQKKRDYLEWNGKIDSKEAEGTLKKMLDEMDEQKSAK